MKIALFGNPNTGKSTVFNLLTGLRQKIGNFPGVTVEKKVGTLTLEGTKHEIIDVPGVYSLYPANKEEKVVYTLLTQSPPDLGIVIADASNLARSLFLFSQLTDHGIPLVLVINMMDVAEKKGMSLKLETLQNSFKNTPIVVMNARVGLGKQRLLEAIQQQIKKPAVENCFLSKSLVPLEDLKGQELAAEKHQERVKKISSDVVQIRPIETKKSALDTYLVHPVFGYIIFAVILFVIFQFVFLFASYPMDGIEWCFQHVSEYLNAWLPDGAFQNLICSGIIPGISGVLVFIPQIAILFFFIALLEDSGYLARAVFLMDRLVRPFGLNGRSVVPLLSSMACAIPGIMATRGIPNYRERITTIFVAPLMSCSARIPVYTLLISMVIPKHTFLGIIQLQALVLLGLYLLGIFSALGIAWILKILLKQPKRSYYMMEIPSFKRPLWRNILMTVLEKIKVFTTEAGGIILAISIVLWALASYGPSNRRQDAITKLKHSEKYIHSTSQDKVQMKESLLLENSYIGLLGKNIEPIIEPIGYDWKIGIALITSFVAREVFVGSLSTIYAHSDSNKPLGLRERLLKQKRKDGSPQYDLKTGLSLMVFYVFAMQCLSTLAIVKRETGSWKWPSIQLLSFGALAYISSFLVFHMF